MEMEVKSSELRPGDVVHCHGMRVLLDREIKCNPHGSYMGMPVYYSLGLVVNRDEVSPDSVPYGYTSHSGETEPRWSVQGNDNARWWIERR